MATLTNDELVEQMNRQSAENLEKVHAVTDVFMKNLLVSPSRFAPENSILVKVHDDYFAERAENWNGPAVTFVTNTILSRAFLAHRNNR